MSASPLKGLVEAGGRLAADISQAALQGQSPLDVFLADPIVALNLRSLVAAFLTFLLLLYGFWILFGGATWYLSYKMLDKNTVYKSLAYIIKFSVVSAVWFVVYTVLIVLVTRFIGFALLRPDQILSSTIILRGVNVMNVILFYFVFISLALVPYTNIKENFKRTFTKGSKEAPTFLATYIIIILAFYLNFKISALLFSPLSLSLLLTQTLQFLLAAPFLVWARMYLITVAKKVTG